MYYGWAVEIKDGVVTYRDAAGDFSYWRLPETVVQAIAAHYQPDDAEQFPPTVLFDDGATSVHVTVKDAMDYRRRRLGRKSYRVVIATPSYVVRKDVTFLVNLARSYRELSRPPRDNHDRLAHARAQEETVRLANAVSPAEHDPITNLEGIIGDLRPA